MSSPVESRFAFYNANYRKSAKSFNDRLRYYNKHGVVHSTDIYPINTKSEKRIRKMSAIFRTRPNWMSLIKDQLTINNWTDEAKAEGLTIDEIHHVFDELRCYEAMHVEDSNVFISAVDRVWFSDMAIDSNTANLLQTQVADLENVPAAHQDWYPLCDAKKTVLSLVDPSLFLLSYERSGIAPKPIPSASESLNFETYGSFPQTLSNWKKAAAASMGTNTSELPIHVPLASTWSASPHYSWLPSEFYVAEDGETTIQSYINNLHPTKHSAMYSTIAAIFKNVVPIFEQVVTDAVYLSPPRVIAEASGWYIVHEEMPTDYNSSDYAEKIEKWRQKSEFLEPQPDTRAKFLRPIPPQCLRNRRLQVVVRMYNVALTPEMPEYPGTEWYAETMSNERIIAVCVCCYSEENVTQGTIEFRERVKNSVEYVEGDKLGLNLVYGIFQNMAQDLEILRQHVGHVEFTQGRCIGFPNSYQHKMSSFRLQDPSKPGHRKMLVYYLVDPSVRIPSTETVPPQQKSWWAEKALKNKPLCDLPLIIQENIVRNVSFPLSFEDAVRIRQKADEERSARNAHATRAYFEPHFFYQDD
ncbi:hypothetical protein IW150_000727 [Coemansia sp. RSA 2607]|nr:hypothetical protein IW150_000727 [Coemansia sp. RSA 2607]